MSPTPPHATLPPSHPGQQPCQAFWVLYTPGWDKLRHIRERLAAVLRAQRVEHVIQTGPCLGRPRARWQQTGEGTYLGGWGGPEGQPIIYQTQVPRDALGKRVPWSKELGKTLVDSGCTWAYQRLGEVLQQRSLGLFHKHFSSMPLTIKLLF